MYNRAAIVEESPKKTIVILVYIVLCKGMGCVATMCAIKLKNSFSWCLRENSRLFAGLNRGSGRGHSEAGRPRLRP